MSEQRNTPPEISLKLIMLCPPPPTNPSCKAEEGRKKCNENKTSADTC